MIDLFVSLDRFLFLLLNRDIANPAFDVIFPIITNRSNWLIPGLILAALYIRAAKWQAVAGILLLVAAVAVSDPLVCRVLKPLFGRLRPCNPGFFADGQHLFLEGARFLAGHRGSLAFPSAHAANAFSVATVLVFLHPRRSLWFLIIATAVAFSRIYVGLHYPADVVAGGLLGAGVGAGTYWSYRLVRHALARHATSAATGRD